MSGEEGQPDHTQSPGDRDTATSGYPEQEPGGAQPEGEGARDQSGEPDAPDTDGGRDSGPGTATGNPNAAG
jgi:hypothetical protein